jgi:hypothetical protein
MTDHLTLEPTTALVRVRASEPSGAAASTATFAGTPSADRELLHAEFDAIIAANFPDAAELGQRPAPATAVTTEQAPPPRGPIASAPHRGRGSAIDPQSPWARERAPPSRPSLQAAETE